MNELFVNIITSFDLEEHTPVEQREEFRLICNYYTELEPKYKIDFIKILNNLTLFGVLEEIYYVNELLFDKIERKGKKEWDRLENVLQECKFLLYGFIKGEQYVLQTIK